MANKVLILGASRGIGFGLVRQFLDQGWSVAATVRDPATQAHAFDALKAAPGALELHPLDMRDRAQLQTLAQAIAPGSVDLLIVNAGISGPEHQSVDLATSEDITDLFTVNAVAPVRAARALLPLLKPGRSVIGLMSSILGSVSLNQEGGLDLYRASKAALNSLARSFAVKDAAAHQVGVLVLHPGWVQTDMGGPQAHVTVDQSTAGLTEVLIGRLGANGIDYVDFEGKQLSW